MIGIFIFRRDLRLDDNLALHELSMETDEIIPVFIIDPYQIKKAIHNKSYISNNAIQFMCESIEDLDRQLDHKLNILHGNPKDCILEIIKTIGKDNCIIGFNEDFSPYSIQRDNDIKKLASRTITSRDDLSLIPLHDIKVYKQYGAFYKTAVKVPVKGPIKRPNIKYRKRKFVGSIDTKDLKGFYEMNDQLAQNGGRDEGMRHLKKLQDLKEYDRFRDDLSYKTSNLSAYLNFGCISIRETYYQIVSILGRSSGLLKQLYWRDFFLQAYIKIPFADSYKRYMDERYNRIEWRNNKKEWERLIDAKTGFLIVDAAMNEMKQTGFMHNRARMIVGHFWTKYLMIDSYHPEYGSQVGFSRYLVDAIGCSQNKMNHAWITEFDFPGRRYAPKGASLAGRPMNVDNSTIKKFNKSCEYIKKWLPSLANVPVKDLYNWNEATSSRYSSIHPPPMFDPVDRYKDWIDACRKIN